MKKVLLAYDGSDQSKKALEKCADLAVSLGAEVTVLSVADLIQAAFYASYVDSHSAQELEKFGLESAKEIVDEGKNLLEEKGVKTTVKVVEGVPAETICQVAEKEGYDLVVMGSHGYRGVKSILLGSVSNKVAQCIKIPVLIIK